MTTLDRAFVKAFLNKEQGEGESTSNSGVRILPLSQALDTLAGRRLDKRTQTKRSDEIMATALTHNPLAADVACEIDHFQWPAICTRMTKVAKNELRKVADTIAELPSSPGRLVAMGACQRGEGATTLLLCTAASLIERGLNVLAVDADLDEAQLSRRLGVVAEHGWEEVLAGRRPLAHVIVQSSTEQMAVLPLRDPTAYSLATLERLAEHLDMVRKGYDVVLLNLGPWNGSPTTGHLLSHGIGRRLDLFILVHNMRVTTKERRDKVCAELTVAGVQQVAIAENFAPVS